MNFQNILQNILGNPIFIVILIGLFSTLARVFKSAQEQQAKKRANHDLRKAKRESLRTGSQVSGESSDRVTPVQTHPSKQTKKANWDQKQQMRKDRIEQLRTQRVEQLKKLRQQRSGGQPQSTQSRQPRPQQPQARPSQQRPARVSQARTPTPPTRTPAPTAQAYKRPVAQPYAQPAPRRKPRPKAVSNQSQRQVSDESRRVSNRPSNSPIALGSITNQTPTKSASVRALFRQDIRRAMIAKEILGAPIGLRSPGYETAWIPE